MHRFRPVHLTLLVAVACAAVVLAACGSSSSSGAGATTAASPGSGATTATGGSGATQTQTVKIALDYTANVDYLGIYAAITNGYFAKQHIKPQIIPYANTPAETLVKNGSTDLGITYPPDVIINRAEGLKYKAVAALVAHNTTALAVLASSKFTRPAQLSGQLYGGFGVQSDPPIISAIMKGDGVADPDFKQVVLNTDVITALAHHRIGYTAVFGGIDDVTAEMQGTKLRTFPYRKYLGGAGDYPNAVYVASDQDIATRGPVLKRALTALAQGYEFAAKHPAQAAQILIKDNPTALDKQQAIIDATAKATSTQFLDPAGNWGPLKDSDFVGLGKILKQGGVIKGSLPAASDLYTNSLLPNAN